VNFIRRYPIPFYLIAAFTITYVVGVGAYLLSSKVQALLGTHVPHVNDLVLKFGPSLAGLFMIWVVARRKGLQYVLGRLIRWRASFNLYLVAVGVPPATFLIALLLRGHGSELSTVDPIRALRVFGLQLAINTFLGGGLSEEIGWRGFMLPQLCKRYTPFIASFIVAVAWFAWHVPAYLLTNKAEADPILPFAVIVFPFSIVLAWLYYRSSESLLLPVLLHASINASSYSLLILIPQVTASPAFQPANDWVLAATWFVLALVILVKSGQQLGRNAALNGENVRA